MKLAMWSLPAVISMTLDMANDKQTNARTSLNVVFVLERCSTQGEKEAMLNDLAWSSSHSRRVRSLNPCLETKQTYSSRAALKR